MSHVQKPSAVNPPRAIKSSPKITRSRGGQKVTAHSSVSKRPDQTSSSPPVHGVKMAEIEMSNIAPKTLKLASCLKVTTSSSHSNSVGGVRWNFPDESSQAHSSAPSSHIKTSGTSSQHRPRQTGLKDLRSLQECVQFITHWKEQVDHVCKNNPGEGGSKREAQRSDPRTERSLEESRKLILKWADELHHVDNLLKATPWVTEEIEEDEDEEEGEEENGEVVASEKTQLRIKEWARELQEASETCCGVQSEELGSLLRLLGLKKKKLVNLMPLLEFITWSLLKEDNKTMIPQLWLLAKQRTWKAGIPRYIPNSVWNWICSAAADVTLDPATNHPWLLLSDDHRKVQEALSESSLPYSPQRFDSWPCVLGWEGYGGGRHYWEVDIANKGYWRVGLTTADSKRHGRFVMTPRTGYWALWRSTHQFYACTTPETPLPLELVPRRLGVYLDYEEGQVSFYNADTKSHIYTFTGTFREKLYPLFAPLDGRTLITVIPPHVVKSHVIKAF